MKTNKEEKKIKSIIYERIDIPVKKIDKFIAIMIGILLFAVICGIFA